MKEHLMKKISKLTIDDVFVYKRKAKGHLVNNLDCVGIIKFLVLMTLKIYMNFLYKKYFSHLQNILQFMR